MRTILEIGGGTTPYFMRYNIPWVENDAYICLDMDEKRLVESKGAIQTLAKKGAMHPKSVEYVVRDAVTLPYDDSSIHEVVFSNMLSAPIHKAWDEKGETVRMWNASSLIYRPIMGTEADGDLFYRERKPVMQEALRVLKPGGTLTIYTDLVVYGQHSFNRIIDELSRDMSLVHKVDVEEQNRIDEHNKRKLRGGDMCYCFDAEVLPECSVLRFTKIY